LKALIRIAPNLMNGRMTMNFNQLYADQNSEDIEEISPVRCLLGAVGILLVMVIGFVLCVIGLSL